MASYTTPNKNTTYIPFGVSVVHGKYIEYLLYSKMLFSLCEWLLLMLMNGQVTVAEAKVTKGGEPIEGPYEEKGKVRVAAEPREGYEKRQEVN